MDDTSESRVNRVAAFMQGRGRKLLTEAVDQGCPGLDFNGREALIRKIRRLALQSKTFGLDGERRSRMLFLLDSAAPPTAPHAVNTLPPPLPPPFLETILHEEEPIQPEPTQTESQVPISGIAGNSNGNSYCTGIF